MKDINQSSLNRAAQIIRQAAGGKAVDVFLREAVREHSFWSPAERRLLVRAVQSYYRWLRWLPGKDSLQTQAEAALALQDRFEKSESSVKVEALRARAIPEWLSTEMEPDADFLRQLQRQPALWLRTRAGKLTQVAESLKDCAVVDFPLPGASSTLQLLRYNGQQDLYRSEAFQAGLFEIQDLTSQCVSLLCAPQQGENWWDVCAGEGGKTLHLADLMAGKGMVWASDRSAKRLATLKKRAARAEAFNYRSAPWESGAELPTKVLFDGILLDAPCSGIGTWQRNPQARWTTGPKDVQELAAIQAGLLEETSRALKPGGKLVYSVCTLARSETSAVAEAFSLAHPDFEPQPSTTLMPGKVDANGMFIAIWKRRS